MRESIGAAMLIKIIIIFIFIYVCFLAIAINYSTTFRVKDNIISIIEEYEGVKNAETAINEYISTVSYASAKVDTVNIGSCDSKTSSYCILPLQSYKGGTYYKVIVYLRFNFPIIGNILQFPVSGETIVLDNYDGVNTSNKVTPTIPTVDDGVCDDGDVEFTSWKCNSLCSGGSVKQKPAITANYKKCVDGKWLTTTKSVEPTVAHSGNTYTFTWTFKEGSITETKEMTINDNSCTGTQTISIPVNGAYVNCGSGVTITSNDSPLVLKTRYNPTNTLLRNIKWNVISGSQYLNITKQNNLFDSCPLSTSFISSANISITDKALNDLKTKEYVEAVVSATNENNMVTTCSIKIKSPAPTCSIDINNKGVTMNFLSSVGVKDYQLKAGTSQVYEYHYNTAKNSGTVTEKLDNNVEKYYGYVTDVQGNTGTCTSPVTHAMWTKTDTETYTSWNSCCGYYQSCTYGMFWGNQCNSYCYGCDVTKTRETTVKYCEEGYEKINDSLCVKTSNITLNWDEYGGSMVPNGTCTYTKNLSLPSAPTKDGYVFNGWLLADNKTYKAAGSTVDGGCIETYTGVASGTSKSIRASWCKECETVENGSCEVDKKSIGKCVYNTKCNEGYSISGSGTYNPTCTVNIIDIDFDENGGSAVSNGGCYYGSALILPDAPKRDGYKFNGWKLADGTIVSAGETIENGCMKLKLGVDVGTSTKIKADWSK